ncbi:D-2-hydroxyacid dehydrogenase [Campylobacter sp. MIT 12-5580]|uniref:D-2-hydroxyacid dehydrogenase n=1 Tax=Campylobacter sp. MIT 12-5580 TaxID=2040651 RepID=UPI0010F850CA|nr:D-2-hydroxyacid dehydrogenase [Campylobacter sp. MIT 12-5580]TKX30261.1 D-2-hydroxyacid dehydrogenase [Campylobacter sp. MIT 12-5580]
MKIVCLDALTLGEADLSAFRDFGEFVSYELTSTDEVIQRLKGADVAVVNKVIIDEEVIDNTNLKLILETATGTNNIAVEYAQNKGIVVKNVAGYSTSSVTQHTFALLFAFLNHVVYYDTFTKSGAWCKSAIFTDFSRIIHTLEGKNYGIIGLGSIGKQVANIASSFGAKVFYHSTTGANLKADFTHLSLEDLLKTCDIISIHAPLNEKTKKLISQKELELMKDGAILINVGRGGIVDEEALALVLDKKDIRVALDVLEHEPMRENHPLLKIKDKEKLIITPHIAFASAEAMKKLIEMVLENLKEFVKNGK